ncbi:hypothetical protein PUN28_015701 [Cardiocondyla obscurior]|uniref:BHLH domain-containing protein n=1 Tax=Cardiocondyla obscurior TaxID=286306 RepID=A0AAW2EVG4_9HYME
MNDNDSWNFYVKLLEGKFARVMKIRFIFQASATERWSREREIPPEKRSVGSTPKHPLNGGVCVRYGAEEFSPFVPRPPACPLIPFFPSGLFDVASLISMRGRERERGEAIDLHRSTKLPIRLGTEGLDEEFIKRKKYEARARRVNVRAGRKKRNKRDDLSRARECDIVESYYGSALVELAGRVREESGPTGFSSIVPGIANEEIDVVSLGNLRQKTDDDDDDELTPCNNIAETAESANATDADVTYVNATDANALDEDEVDVSVPSTFRGRPRGRPPGPNSAKRKRTAQTAQLFSEGENDQPGPVLKRARVRNDQLADSLQNLSQQDGGDDEAKKRYNHNCMERLRRENMKASFDKLRKSIPEIAQNRKVSKVSILKHAKNYIDMWEPITKGNERTFDALIKRRQELEELAESLGIPVKKIKVKNYVTKHASFRFLAND